MNVLVTGGAGYVGSVLSERLIKRGHKVVIIDNLQQGHKGAILPGANFILGDIRDDVVLSQAFQRFPIDVVMHMAGETVVEHSTRDPGKFFKTNSVCGINILDKMLEHNVTKLIFSSSAAVYGEPLDIPIEENQAANPVNAYGESKLIFERILKWYGKAYGLKHISLRYFNAAGASETLGEEHDPETHLIPIVLKAALDPSNSVDIFGTDYPTKDKSCIRDYVHVVDIAQAHILALENLQDLSGSVYNLGNGGGYSVLEVVDMAKKVTGVDIRVRISPRRPGDPAILVASSKRAKSELGWKPEFPKLESIIESAWRWMRRYPNGYKRER